jgi:hypothetical protein
MRFFPGFSEVAGLPDQSIRSCEGHLWSGVAQRTRKIQGSALSEFMRFLQSALNILTRQSQFIGEGGVELDRSDRQEEKR